MPEPILSVESVSRLYVNDRVVALKDISLRVSRGEYLAVLGPSGSGKSTLLYMLCGLDRPSHGSISFAGEVPTSLARWAAIRARHFGFIFQSFNLLTNLTALENVQVPMFGVTANRRARDQRARALLARVGLADRLHHRPGQLSGGEQQRVAIARSFANSPDIVLADEPTGSLDSRASAEVMTLLADAHAENGSTLVVVTHNEQIAKKADHRIHIVDGRIVAGG